MIDVIFFLIPIGFAVYVAHKLYYGRAKVVIVREVQDVRIKRKPVSTNGELFIWHKQPKFNFEPKCEEDGIMMNTWTCIEYMGGACFMTQEKSTFDTQVAALKKNSIPFESDIGIKRGGQFEQIVIEHLTSDVNQSLEDALNDNFGNLHDMVVAYRLFTYSKWCNSEQLSAFKGMLPQHFEEKC